MREIPDRIVLSQHRDLEGRRQEVWVRRSLLVLIGIVPLLALFNVFGQRPHLATAAAPAATLELYAPGHVRGGLLFEARFTVYAHRDLAKATLVLDRGWMEGLTINSIAPSPISEGSRDGKLVLELGHVSAGTKYSVYVYYQVNPTNVGRRSQAVRLYDGERLIATVHRIVSVFP